MHFILDMVPPKTTHQAGLRILKRRGGAMFIGKKSSSKAISAVRTLSVMLLPFRPAVPFGGPLRLSVLWVYPWRKSEPKKNRLKGSIPCDTRPDCDNICKALCDCMTKQGFWHDDSQVAGLNFNKRWGDRPRIEIEIERAT